MCLCDGVYCPRSQFKSQTVETGRYGSRFMRSPESWKTVRCTITRMDPCTEIWQSTLLISGFTWDTHVLPDLYNDLVNTAVHCLVYLKSLLQLGSETCKRNSTGQSTGKLTCAECNQRCRNCKNRLLHSSKRTCVRA